MRARAPLIQSTYGGRPSGRAYIICISYQEYLSSIWQYKIEHTTTNVEVWAAGQEPRGVAALFSKIWTNRLVWLRVPTSFA